jgi:hypothetical protein
MKSFCRYFSLLNFFFIFRSQSLKLQAIHSQRDFEKLQEQGKVNVCSIQSAHVIRRFGYLRVRKWGRLSKRIDFHKLKPRLAVLVVADSIFSGEKPLRIAKESCLIIKATLGDQFDGFSLSLHSQRDFYNELLFLLVCISMQKIHNVLDNGDNF